MRRLFVAVFVSAAMGAGLGLLIFCFLLASNVASVRDGIAMGPHPRELVVVLAATLMSMLAVGPGLTGFLLTAAAEPVHPRRGVSAPD